MRPYFIGASVTKNKLTILLNLKTTKIHSPENEGTFFVRNNYHKHDNSRISKLMGV